MIAFFIIYIHVTIEARLVRSPCGAGKRSRLETTNFQ